MREGGQVFAVDALVVFGVGHGDPEKVICVPGHQMAFQDIRARLHGPFEGVQCSIALTAQGDLDEDSGGLADSARIEDGGVAVDHTAVFESLQASQTSRLGQVNFLRQIRIGHPPMVLQQTQELTVSTIKIHVVEWCDGMNDSGIDLCLAIFLCPFGQSRVKIRNLFGQGSETISAGF